MQDYSLFDGGSPDAGLWIVLGGIVAIFLRELVAWMNRVDARKKE